MKKLFFLLIGVLGTILLYGQENFSVPKLTTDQEKEVLFNHVMAYSITGISFAKTKGVSPEAYGRFIGKKFTTYWDPDAGFPLLVNQMMFILAGMYPDNQMQIVEQDEKSITFRLKNVDLAFQGGPMFDVTYQDFLDCAYGVISELSGFMHANFSHRMTDDGWYIVSFSKK